MRITLKVEYSEASSSAVSWMRRGIGVALMVVFTANNAFSEFSPPSPGPYDGKAELLGPITCRDILFRALPAIRDPVMDYMWQRCYVYCTTKIILEKELAKASSPESRKMLEKSLGVIQKILQVCFIGFRVSYFVFHTLALRKELNNALLKGPKTIPMEE